MERVRASRLQSALFLRRILGADHLADPTARVQMDSPGSGTAGETMIARAENTPDGARPV
jgi:hypothetical protein